MSQDHEPDDIEKLAHAIGLIGEAFAAMSREIGKHLADFGKRVSDAFDEAADERAVREADHHDDKPKRTCSAVSTYLITPSHNGPRRHGGKYGGPLECILEVPHTGKDHYCGCCGVHWRDPVDEQASLRASPGEAYATQVNRAVDRRVRQGHTRRRYRRHRSTQESGSRRGGCEGE